MPKSLRLEGRKFQSRKIARSVEKALWRGWTLRQGSRTCSSAGLCDPGLARALSGS